MTIFQNKFDKAIWQVVLNIPAGRMLAYGEVARAAGFPRHARMVSKAMVRSPKPLPWYRVVRANRSLGFEKGSDTYKKQLIYLKVEGVIMKKGKLIPLETDTDKTLDELLWG